MLLRSVRTVERLCNSASSSFLSSPSSVHRSSGGLRNLLRRATTGNVVGSAFSAPASRCCSSSVCVSSRNEDELRSEFTESELRRFPSRAPATVRLVKSRRKARRRTVVGAAETAYSAIELALDSVVKIFTVSSSPNYSLPWQNKSQRESMGSGFVIPGRKILTNAHVVADHTFVLVRKHGSPTKYRAEVQAVGHECDLAILVIDNKEFWEGMNSLELGDIPFLQEAVAVVGYPQGGDNISVTKGVVSRVEPTQYVHGATQLMAIQIDAAINPGNSGGPAIMGNKVAGVAFQNLSGAENIGYIIPVPVIKHFISGVEESGKYVGFCSLGISCQPMENAQLRNNFKMSVEMTGVLISKINPLSDAHRVLKKDDIILAFDGVAIANDGTVPFRNRERITFDHLVSMKKPNETALVKVLRDGTEHEFIISLKPLQPLVPVHQFDTLPSYYIFAGFVFVPLTQPYLHEYGEDWYNSSPRRLCERALRDLPKKAGEQLVILSQVLMDDINTGYERLAELQVKKVNGVEVDNLRHLCQLIEKCSDENLRLDLDDERVIVLNYPFAKIATSRILKRHRIPSSMSSDLLSEQNTATESVACAA
ncbi:PREDICTED: protease Do-like 10, mitochondrial [Tarenaya hassleriana]|uniref:protease Do-like 10, mitochondrial n=1 Tax=Tarenaya hassleriana TaxID=28532 RepID=UPI00053C97A5|nr:PREDICTED: protease Do-like 10, mitochondrial [Tarenaya hassleriana]